MNFLWLYCSSHELSLLNWLKLKPFHIPWQNSEFFRRIGIELVNLIILAYNFFIVIVLTYWNLHSILAINLPVLAFRLMKWWHMRLPIVSDLAFSLFQFKHRVHNDLWFLTRGRSRFKLGNVDICIIQHLYLKFKSHICHENDEISLKPLPLMNNYHQAWKSSL
jgi:hypothetical protein